MTTANPSHQHAAPAHPDSAAGRAASGPAECGPGRGISCWSVPPLLPAGTAAKRRADRFLPRTCGQQALFIGAVLALLIAGSYLPARAGLAVAGAAALIGGAYCTASFWRCRWAHCAVSGAGWLGLSLFTFTEAGLGHSLIGGREQLVFLGVLVASLAFEGAYYLVRGTNAVRGRAGHASR